MYILIAFITLTTHYFVPSGYIGSAKVHEDKNKTVVMQEFTNRSQCQEVLSKIRSNTKAEGICIEKSPK